VFGLSTPPMPCCPLLQCVNQALIKIPDYKVCHLSPLLCQPDDCNDSTPSGVIWQSFLLSGSENETSLLALHLHQGSFGLGQPEGHVHGTGQINGGRQRRMRLLLLTGGI
jgi:hypothetical protein